MPSRYGRKTTKENRKCIPQISKGTWGYFLK
jgi:hypothetical protein